MNDHYNHLVPDTQAAFRWQAMQYAMGDPSLDRALFEVRLEAEPALAELVAEEVLLLQQVAQAARSTANMGPGQPLHCNRAPVGSTVLRIALVAGMAACFVTAMLSVLPMMRSTNDGSSANAEVANSWVAMIDVEEPGEEAEWLDTDSASSEIPSWMMAALVDGESS
jgi:hypothetical protein